MSLTAQRYRLKNCASGTLIYPLDWLVKEQNHLSVYSVPQPLPDN